MCMNCETEEQCMTSLYNGSYAAYLHNGFCHVAYDDAPSSRGLLWFDAVNRCVFPYELVTSAI